MMGLINRLNLLKARAGLEAFQAKSKFVSSRPQNLHYSTYHSRGNSKQRDKCICCHLISPKVQSFELGHIS